MAIDALKNLAIEIPDWVQRLDKLGEHIDRRQAELAAIAAAEGKGPETKLSNRKDLAQIKARKTTKFLSPTSNKDAPAAYRTRSMIIIYCNYVQYSCNSLTRFVSSFGADLKRKTEEFTGETNIRKLAKRNGSEHGKNDDEIPLLSFAYWPRISVLHNRGSTETLKPQDNPPVVYTEATTSGNILEDSTAEKAAKTPAKTSETPKVYTPSPDSDRKQQDINKPGQARARAKIRKSSTSPPMMSNEDTPTAYRKQTKVIVYYDSYVQDFFKELVKFVSSNRNLMRKAKMAARVDQIKKLAEQDVSEDGYDDDALPSLRYLSSRRFGSMSISRSGAGDQPPHVYDNLDKGLEFVQRMCEHGAHQFLLDGDCNDEISEVQKKLGEVLEMAKTEMERVHREEPELAKETGDMSKIRTRRSISMRRNMSVGLKDGSPPATKELEPAKLEATEPTIPVDPMAPIAVDPNIMEGDEGIDLEMKSPKLQYRSTRTMRSRGP